MQLAKEADEDKEDIGLDEFYCFFSYQFQKELGITLDKDYSVARFMILKDQFIEEVNRIKKEQDKDKE